jgi:ketosteroid isomerase-like protein
MLRLLFPFLLLFISPDLLAQSSDLADINAQVWRPFSRAYAAFDAEAFMALHTTDIVRVSQDGKQIYVGAEYRDRMVSSFERLKAGGMSRSIAFSFTQRLIHAEAAYETGYFKISMQRPGGQTEIFYGRFQIVLRKQAGAWKIAVDTDSSEQQSLGEADFRTGKLLPVE